MVELAVAEREAGAEQGAFQTLAAADTDALAVDGGAAAAAGGELFLAHRVEDHGVLDAAAVLAGDADGEVRQAVDEVGGAVQRIDDPQVVGAVAGALDQAAFLGEDAVVRVGLLQHIDDRLLGGAVNLGHVVLGVLLVDRDCIQAFDRAEDEFAGTAGRAQRDIQHGLHGRVTWVVKESRQF
ncbi:hypothetical protein D3C80_1019330 [compost metagenome]